MRTPTVLVAVFALLIGGCANGGADGADTIPPPPTRDSTATPSATTTTTAAHPTTTTPSTTSTSAPATSTTAPSATTSSTSPELRASCTSPEGFSVAYPDDWETNDGSVVSTCTMFDPDEFSVPEATDQRVAAITIDVEDVPFDTAISSLPATIERSRTPLRVDGLDAVRVEWEASGDGLIPSGTLVTAYFVALAADDATLLANTIDYDTIDYQASTAVLDGMVATLDITAGRTTGVEPIGAFAPAPVTSDAFPASGPPAMLTDVRHGSHDGFERVVFEFGSGASVSYSIEYVERVVPPSGQPMDVEGEAILEVTMTPASAVDLTGPEPRETYAGPERFDGLSASIPQLVEVEDFENVLTWALGLDRRFDLAVATLEDPLRLVIDIPTR